MIRCVRAAAPPSYSHFPGKGTGLGASRSRCCRISLSECAGSVEISRTGRRPFLSAECTEKEAAKVVLPTPPLPTNSESRATQSFYAYPALCSPNWLHLAKRFIFGKFALQSIWRASLCSSLFCTGQIVCRSCFNLAHPNDPKERAKRLA